MASYVDPGAPAYAALELRLRRPDDADGAGADFRVDTEYTPPHSAAAGPARAGRCRVDLAALRAHETDLDAYGDALGGFLFADPAVRRAFDEARAQAAAANAALRVRLAIDPGAAELHRVRWEALRVDGERVFTDERVPFSRYVTPSDSYAPVPLQARPALRALVVVTDPANVSDYGPDDRPLAPVDVALERDLALGALGEVRATVIAARGQATLNNIVDQLRNEFDILYLVCHGAVTPRGPQLFLEDESGEVAPVAASRFAKRLKELPQRPVLVVLASCQSAGTGTAAGTTAGGDAARATADDGALSALGPQLAEVGIPAVLAMQGNILVDTTRSFMKRFFRELRRDGQIDRAVAAARSDVTTQSDWWAPVLFMRLQSGGVWATGGGTAAAQEDFQYWDSLVRWIRNRQCTPILGPGLTDRFVGSRRELARLLADAEGFPLARHRREDLAQVAQFVSAMQGRGSLIPRILELLVGRAQPAGAPPLALGALSVDELVEAYDALVTAAWTQATATSTESHLALAGIPFRDYVTTNADGLLEQALRARGREPVSHLCAWRGGGGRAFDAAAVSRETPLVYHLFGKWEQPSSLVLTEDDYFDFLIGITKNECIPTSVRSTLSETALLFLGFQMEDWNFRVLLRSILHQEGGGRRNDFKHVAVQIDPETGSAAEVAAARRYLNEYFRGADINIYWGTVDQFIAELDRRFQDDERRRAALRGSLGGTTGATA